MKRNYLILLGAAATMAACTSETTVTETAENVVPGYDTSYLDHNVNACEHFFHYATGGWHEANPRPETESRWGSFNILIEENNKKLRTLVEELSSKEGLEKGSDAQLIGDLYYSGMDSAKIEADGVDYMMPYLDEVNAIESMADFTALWSKYDLIGFGKPFGFGVGPDSKNSTRNVMYLGASGLGLPDRDYYLRDDSASMAIQQNYRNHMRNMFVLLGRDSASAAAQAEVVYNVEAAMAPLHYDRVSRRNPYLTYNMMSKDEMMALNTNIDYEAYFAPLNVDFDSLIVSNPKHFEAIGRMMDSIPVADWKQYTEWKVLSGSAGRLPMAFVDERFDFYARKLSGVNEMKPRWRRMMGTLNTLGDQMGHIFADKYFPEEQKQKVIDMVENIRAAYRMRIQNLDWMSDSTKTLALEKLNAFTYKIGYPDEWEDYSDLDISRESYYKNLMNINEYLSRKNYAELNEPVDKGDWFMGAHIVNAYYYPLNNEVVFPAGILQPPFYNPDADDAINYGAIGGVIGHELTHGFDDKGSLYDAEGNLRNWWSDEDKKRFDTLVNRVIEQYNGYEPLPGVNVNGALTVGENIADLGGLTLAYHAYLESRKELGPAEPIDGFTDVQRVFLGWAQLYASVSTDEALKLQVNTDSHSPAEFRVIGVMSNMPEFEEAFGCGEGSETFVRPDSAKITIW